ncbi:MAG: hypothetical protein EXX96DRAFT_619318 [Benjaminiella poitrasii]|nr:MAG: hypothetical protein EXX96DRAFT_619318 [Benjaminiella poitrasii]
MSKQLLRQASETKITSGSENEKGESKDNASIGSASNSDDFIDTGKAGIVRPRFLDLGRKSAYMAAMNLDQHQLEIRCYITKEYYHLTGSIVYAKRLQREKDATGIITIEYVIRFLWFCTAKPRLNLYQEKQRELEMMVNMLLNGGTKCGKEKWFKKKNKKEKRKK